MFVGLDRQIHRNLITLSGNQITLFLTLFEQKPGQLVFEKVVV